MPPRGDEMARTHSSAIAPSTHRNESKRSKHPSAGGTDDAQREEQREATLQAASIASCCARPTVPNICGALEAAVGVESSGRASQRDAGVGEHNSESLYT